MSIDGHSTEFSIPRSAPATIQAETWAKQLAFFATARTETEAEFSTGVFPKSATHDAIDLEEFKKQASFARIIKRGELFIIDPRTTFPGDGLGESGPLEIKITWVP